MLRWPAPADLPLDKAANLERGWSERTAYVVTYVPESKAGAADAHFTLDPKPEVEPYFDQVELGPPNTPGRWRPVVERLGPSGLYVSSHYDERRAIEAAKTMQATDPRSTNQAFRTWLDATEVALMRAPVDHVPAMGEWVEVEFAKRFGDVQPIALVKSDQAFTTHQMVEMLGKFAVMPAPTLADYIARSDVQEILAEGAHNHASANYFIIPMAISFPEWLGQSMATVSWAALFVVSDPYQPPYLDAQHRDIWNAWVGSWFGGDGDEIWEILRPARQVAFVRWYVDRINELLGRLGDPGTTASISGEVRPLRQIALTRTVLALQDIVGRCLITSDPYGRSMWAMLALSRFDDLGWGFEQITNGDFMTDLMAPLADDAEIGALYGTYGLRVWRSVMGGIVQGAAGTWNEQTGRVELLDGSSPRAETYCGQYLKAVRDTIHRFSPAAIEDRFNLHRGTLPISLSQFAVLLWLRFLVDPTRLIQPFRT